MLPSPDTVPARPEPSAMVDWSLAGTVARRLSTGGPRVGLIEAADLVADLRERSVRAAALVTGVTGLEPDPPGTAPAAAEVIDRSGWIDLNVGAFRAAIDPLLAALDAERSSSGAVTAVGRTATGAELGAVLAFLSGRVLGQYEALANEPGRLVMVAPNVLAAERAMRVAPGDFRLWVAVHEVTHRTQFGVAPWLREHVLSGIGELVGGEELSSAALRRRLTAGLGEVVGALRRGEPVPSLIDLAQTPAQRAVLDRLTATMSLLEGHAEYVMNAVGVDAIATLPVIKERFERRRQSGGSMSKLLKQLLGIDAKMRQYSDGERFTSAVVDRAGMDVLNRAWSGPDALPTLTELHDPDAWLARVG